MRELPWMPPSLHPVVVRLARADELAYTLAQVALDWSRGHDDRGPLTIQQVERTVGIYDVEVSAIRPVPPMAAALFSEAIHHLRSSIDNVIFGMVELKHDIKLTDTQRRAVSMPIYDEPAAYERKMAELVRKGLTLFDSDEPMRQRTSSLQPFNDDSTVASLRPDLAAAAGLKPSYAKPLALLREYSNEDKHRTIRLAAARVFVQRDDDWTRSVSEGMRVIQEGTVLERVTKGSTTVMDLQASLHVQRPDGAWVPFGPELDALARHVADVVIPTLITGVALPRALAPEMDLTDNGQTLLDRVASAGSRRAHERAGELAAQAYIDSVSRGAQSIPATNRSD